MDVKLKAWWWHRQSLDGNLSGQMMRGGCEQPDHLILHRAGMLGSRQFDPAAGQLVSTSSVPADSALREGRAA